MFIVIMLMIVIVVWVFALLGIFLIKKKQKQKEEEERKLTEEKIQYSKYLKSVRESVKLEQFVSLQDFFVYKNRLMSGDITGVYVLYNQTKDMYYVGQAKNLYQRVNQHFTGHGNGDVYADYKYGSVFWVRAIPLVNSGYSSLDALERNYIEYYEAYTKGYNKNSGNK